MQDLIQNYVSDLHKLREVFHKELEATAEELSKAMALYAKRCDAALASFMEKASARESELEFVSGGKAQSVLRSAGKRRSAGRRKQTACANSNTF